MMCSVMRLFFCSVHLRNAGTQERLPRKAKPRAGSDGVSKKEQDEPIAIFSWVPGFLISFQSFRLRAPRVCFETRSLPTLTRSYPRRFTFYVALPDRSIVVAVARRRQRCRGPCISAVPAALDCYPRGVTGHVAHPSRSILKLERLVCSRS